ncbi:MAG: UvrB/UvrC motif-containing protein, partial [Candidatus Roizmanbacteria bacterium]|nr:UvrB/UvrC motif-containing protein [Candidatus Roizmanbacteria bacterium]
ILDADKEGFLRNETTLIQTMGRASRHINGRVIMYADTLTYSMEKAIKETERRRKIQQKFNREHGITPQGIKKEIRPVFSARGETSPFWGGKNPTIKNFQSLAVEDLVKEMKIAAKNLDFEKAAKLRDLIKKNQIVDIAKNHSKC